MCMCVRGLKDAEAASLHAGSCALHGRWAGVLLAGLQRSTAAWCMFTPQRVPSLTREFLFIALEMNMYPTETPPYFAPRLPYQPRGHSPEGYAFFPSRYKATIQLVPGGCLICCAR